MTKAELLNTVIETHGRDILISDDQKDFINQYNNDADNQDEIVISVVNEKYRFITRPKVLYYEDQ